MSEVIDIIHRLSYQVTDAQSLKTVIDNFKAQASEIERITNLRAKLQAQIDKGLSPEKTTKYKAAVDDLTKRIDAQTQSLQKQFQQSNVVQQGLQKELGIIQKLTDKINDLRQARERQTSKSGIEDINKQLRIAQDELKALTQLSEQTSNNGIFAQLFGIGSAGGAGRQIFQGVLAGVGIGAGFSIIPALVGSLTEYIGKLIDSRSEVNKTKEALAGLNNELAHQVDGVLALNQTLSNFFAVGSTAFGGYVQQIKAQGVVRGEVFEQERKVFDAQQEQRKLEFEELSTIGNKYTDLQRILQRFDKSGNLNSLRQDIAGLGLSDLDQQKIQVVIDNFYKQRNALPASQRFKVQLSDNVELTKLIAEAQTKANLKFQEIENEKIRFEAERVEKIYQLNLQLQERLKTLRSDNLRSQISAEQQYNEDVLRLVESLDSERADALRKFDKEREVQIKELGAETIETERNNNNIRLQLIQQFDLKRDAALNEANQRRIDAEKRARDIILSTSIGSLGSINAVNASGGTLSLDTILQQQDAVEQQQRNALAEQRRQALADARKFNVDTINLEKEFDAAEIALQQKQNRDRLDLQLKYYSDLLNLVKAQSQSALLDLLANPTAQGANAEAFLSGEQSAGDFRRRGVRASFEDARRQNDLNRRNREQELTQAAENAARVRLNPNSTPEDLRKATDEVNRLKGAIQELDKSDAQLISNEQLRQINIAISLFQQLTETVVEGYNIIADARQRDYQREIDVREQRVELALKLAERGNTEALALEQERLQESQKQQREAALQQQAINGALTVSNSLVAVAKAAAEGGIFAPATIAAVLAALVTGFATVKSIGDANQNLEGFAEGVVGYKGKGTGKSDSNTVRISNGESIMTEEATKKYAPYLERMNAGLDPFPQMGVPKTISTTKGFVSNDKFDMLADKLDSVADAVGSIKVHQSISEHGVHQLVQKSDKAIRRKYSD